MKNTLLFLIILLNAFAYGQEHKFENYNSFNGIPQDFIYAIHQDKDGFLWIGTGDGLSRFDGNSFFNYSIGDGLAENNVTSSFNRGDVDYFGHNEGGITVRKKDEFSIIEHDSLLNSPVVAFFELRNAVFLVSQNEGIFKIENNKVKPFGKFELENFSAVEVLDENNLLVGTSEGLAHIINNGKEWVKEFVYNSENWVTSILKLSNSSFIFGCQTGPIFKGDIFAEEIQISQVNLGRECEELVTKKIVLDQQKNIWIATLGNGVLKFDSDECDNLVVDYDIYTESKGLPNNYTQTIFEDYEENVWIGTFGSGLSKFSDDFFTFYNYNKENVISFWKENARVWFGLEKGFSFSINDNLIYFNDTTGFINDQVNTFYKSDTILWIGTENNGVYYQNINDFSITKLDWDYGKLKRKINHLLVKNDRLLVATNGGLLIYNLIDKSILDFSTEDGLGHNSIKSVFQTSKDDIYIGTQSNSLFKLENTTIVEVPIVRNGEIKIVDITEDNEGNIWFASAENGVFKLQDSLVVTYNEQNGLYSNYTYAIEKDINNNIWVGHRNGLSKIESSTSKINIYSEKQGITGKVNYRSIYQDNKQYLWFGTDLGLIKYDVNKDKEIYKAPKLNLKSIIINDKRYSPNEDIELPHGDYRIKFEYVGISLRHPKDVLYQTKLEGYDEIYSNHSFEPYVYYGKITDGEYTLKVKACSGPDACSDEISSIKITVLKPFWKKWWFFLLVLAAIVLITVFIFRYRTRRMRSLQKYLEKQLNLKTKEVVEKAEKIDNINQDLTSSINYAKKIQNSILPQKGILSSMLPGSFIFYKPRDIVSGDFFFIREIENKLIVACVDCTGHGVPGAFMSMIGAVTLRNIYNTALETKNWKSPKDVLEKLDEEIQIILRQRAISIDNINDAYSRSRDGMDLTLCEIDTETNKLIVSSAKRSSVIIQNGKAERIRGDKRSIGGAEDYKDSFTNQEFMMSKNDVIYLFTDGFTDQFGGDNNKKIGLANTLKMLEGLERSEESKRKEFVKDYFHNWKGENKQIDDVLMIGLRF